LFYTHEQKSESWCFTKNVYHRIYRLFNLYFERLWWTLKSQHENHWIIGSRCRRDSDVIDGPLVAGRHNWYVQITPAADARRTKPGMSTSVPRRDDRRTVVWRHLSPFPPLPLLHRRTTWSWYRIHGPLPQDSGPPPRFSAPALPYKKREYRGYTTPRQRSVTPDRQNRRYHTTKRT